MKAISSSSRILALVAIVSITSVAPATLVGQPQQSPVPLSFLSSSEALRAYAAEQSTAISASLYSPSQIVSPAIPVTVLPGGSHSGQVILDAVSAIVPTITVLNGADPVYMYVSIRDKNNNELFTGYSQNQPILGKGGYSLPKVTPLIRLSSNIAVKMPKNVAWAEMEYVDPITGLTDNYQMLNANGATIYFPTDSAGKGYLVVNYTDGTQVDFDLRNGGTATAGAVLTQQIGSPTIEDYQIFKDPTQVVDVIVSNNGIGMNQTYEADMSGTAAKYVTFSVSTTEGVFARGYWYRANGTEAWSYVSATPGSQYVQISLTGGVWYILADFDPAKFHSPEPVIWNGGKGA